MSELKDNLKEVDVELAQTIVESISEDHAARDSAPQVRLKVVDEAKPLVIKAMPYYKYYFLRFVRLLYAFAVSGLTSLLIGILVSLSGQGSDLFGTFQRQTLNLWMFSAFLLQLLSGLGIAAFPSSPLIVTNSRGEKISVGRAAWRALLWMSTVVFFPLHIVVVACGGRRFLHDVLSGTYVREPGEDPAKTFYPPMPRIWAVLLVVACAGLFSQPLWIESNIRKLAFIAAPDNKNYLAWGEGPEFSQMASFVLSLKQSASGANSFEVTKALLVLVCVSAKEHKVDQCLDAITMLSQRPEDEVRLAMTSLSDSLGFDPALSPKLLYAMTLLELGKAQLALEIAEEEYRAALKADDPYFIEPRYRVYRYALSTVYGYSRAVQESELIKNQLIMRAEHFRKSGQDAVADHFVELAKRI